ncbi:prtrc system protein e [Chishuiella sp.]|uniref:prtrc system protein e n=1 Tax=Chishuiella sp. TaxID=1969467 RepID=UPI0028ABA91C|nr:prtrc system protein e [Chishuiella sp.]
MNSNFFNQIAQLDFIGNLQLTITKGVGNNLIVSVLLNNDNCNDNAKNSIPPLLFNATAQEFDKELIQQISSPIQIVSSVMVDMELFLKQMEKVKKQSTKEKEKTEKTKNDKQSKDKKYEDTMLKVNKLEKEGKFREAWKKVPESTEFPQKVDEIRKRKSQLSAQFSNPNLFGTIEQETASKPH